MESRGGAIRPPVALGCGAAVAAVLFTAGVIAFALVFLDSGADSGRLVLEDSDAYALGSVTFAGQRNIYLVRLSLTGFYALSDLDAANRANSARRCRVSPIPAADPELRALLTRYAPRTNPLAAEATLLFRETCNGATYDATGVRLDSDGPNLDRFPVDVGTDGRVIVDLAQRQCTQRDGAVLFSETECP